MTEMIPETRVDEVIKLLHMTKDIPSVENVSSEDEDIEIFDDIIISEDEPNDSNYDPLSHESSDENDTGNRSSQREHDFKTVMARAQSSQRKIDDNETHKCPTYMPETKDEAKNVKTPLEAWSLLFSDSILEKIVIHTNEEMERKLPTRSKQSYHRETNMTEIKAFIGLLYLSGVQKSNKSNLEELWSNEFDPNLFKSVMSLHRFLTLESCIQFDDKNTRTIRREDGKLAPIREIWDMFITNCIKYYIPSQNCTVGEQFLSFRGKCPFKIHVGKPDGYGMKLIMLNDSKTSYMVNAIPYTGRILTESSESIASHYVKTLTKPIHKTGRNITCDDWLTSVEICDQMLTNDYGLTMVGTIRRTTCDEPILKHASEENRSSITYVPKNHKLFVLSTLHRSENTNKNINKSEIISFYNETRGGTDDFNQLCYMYTTSKRINRWSTRFFFGMLDQAGVNANILYYLNFDNERINRQDFLKSLAMSLITPQLRVRSTIPSLAKHLRVVIENVLGERRHVELRKDKLQKRKRCYFCSSKDDRKTSYCCFKCTKPICDSHRRSLCHDCAV